MSGFIDLTGQKFGRLTVIKPDGRDKCGNRYWLCECECGNVKRIVASSLKTGATRSCGCLRRDTVIEKNHGLYKHGMSGTKPYNEWRRMVERCSDPKSRDYPDYGGRGIQVCDEWRRDIMAFYNDVCQLPHFNEVGYSLDRIDNDGNYEPGNVRFADKYQQANNKRNNVRMTYNGETHTVHEWGQIIGIDSRTLYQRLRRGWSVEDALNTPLRVW